MFFDGNNGYTNTPHYYVLSTLLIVLYIVLNIKPNGLPQNQIYITKYMSADTRIRVGIQKGI